MALVVTGSLALGTAAATLSLEFPRIGYENRCRESICTVSTTNAETDAEGESVLNGLTYDFWQPTTTTSIIAFTFSEAIDADYCGIAGHTLTETGSQIELEYWDASSPAAWVSLGSVLPGDENGNKTIMFLFDEVSSSIFRLTVSGGSTAPVIGAISIGLALKMERKLYGGHTPVTLSKKTVIKPQKSEGGQFLGRSIIREGAGTSIAFKNLTPAFVRASYYPFMESARSYPFFFAWRAGDYPEEIGYCWTSKDISASNSGQAGLMDSSFSVDAIVE